VPYSSDIRIDKEINLMSQQMTEALFSGKGCFLDAEEWRHLSKETLRQSHPSNLSQTIEDCTTYVAGCPGLVERHTPSLRPVKLGCHLWLERRGKSYVGTTPQNYPEMKEASISS
jgi:hypothetical protein